MGYARLQSLLFCAGAALLGPIAGAEAFSEVPYRASPEREVATCLRYAGSPGALAVLGPLGKRSSPTDFVQAEADTLSEGGRASIGALFDCAAVARTRSGTTVLAGVSRRRGRILLRASVRDQSGGAPPVTLSRGARLLHGPVTTAASEQGHALVAWAEIAGTTPRDPGRARLMYATRTPGRRFGSAQALTPWRPLGEHLGAPLVTAGYDAQGRATVAFARPVPDRGRFAGLSALEVATGEPGGKLARPKRIGAIVQDLTRLRLRVAPGGRALLVHDGHLGIRVLERATSGDSFGRVAAFDAGLRVEAGEPDVALREDGSAMVAWRYSGAQGRGGVKVASRSGPVPFGRPTVVSRKPDDSSGSFLAFGSTGEVEPPLDLGNTQLTVALGAGGKAAVAWTARRRPAFGDRPRAAAGVSGTLTQGFSQPVTLGCACRAVNGATAFLNADDAPAIAWTDNVTRRVFSALELPTGAGRLHVTGVPSTVPGPPPPTVRLRAPAARRLAYGEGLPIVARCSGPCDLRAVVPGKGGRVARALATASLDGPGSTTLRVSPVENRTLAPVRPGRVTVVVRAYPPNGALAATERVRVRVSRKPVVPTPLPRNVVARRRGRTVTVTWRTARAARGINFVVAGQRTRARPPQALRFFSFVEGRGRRRFRARLRLKPNDRVRFVSVVATPARPPARERTVVVRVRG